MLGFLPHRRGDVSNAGTLARPARTDARTGRAFRPGKPVHTGRPGQAPQGRQGQVVTAIDNFLPLVGNYLFIHVELALETSLGGLS